MNLGRSVRLGGLLLLVATRSGLAATVSHTEPHPIQLQTAPIAAVGGQIIAGQDGALVTFSDAWGVGARLLDSHGAPLGHPFYLSARPAWQTSFDFPWAHDSPSLARDGTGYLVAWAEGFNETSQMTLQHLDSEGREQGERQQFWRHCCTNLQSLVPTQNGTLLLSCSESLCQSWTFDHTGAYSNGSTLPIPFGPQNMTLAALDGALLAVIENHGNLSLLRLDESGAFVDAAPQALAAGTAASAVAIGGSLGAVWADGDRVLRASVALDGTIDFAADPLFDQVALKAPPKLIELPDGFACLSLEGSNAVVLRLLSRAWQLRGDPLELETNAGNAGIDLSLSADAKNLVATWSTAGGTLVSRSIALDAPTILDEPTPLSSGSFDQETPLALRFDDHWVVVWSEGGVIRGAKLDENGNTCADCSSDYTRFLPTKPYSHPKLLGVSIQAPSPEIASQQLVFQDGSSTFVGWPALPVPDPMEGRSLLYMTVGGQMAARDLSVPGPLPVKFGGQPLVGYVDHSGENYVVSVRSADGDTTQIASVAALPPGASTVPFDLVNINGGYRVWWADERGHVRARDVQGGVVSDGPDFGPPAVTPTFLTATVTAVLAGDDSSAFFKSIGNDWSPATGSVFSELVDIDGSTSVVSNRQGSLSAQLADPNGALAPLDLIGDGNEPSLSEAVDGHLLLAFSRRENVDGATVSRVYVSVLTATELAPNPAVQGGEAGAPTTGDGGEPATGSGGVSATSEGGEPATGNGGVSATNDGGSRTFGPSNPPSAGEASEPTASERRTSASCGCLAAGHDAGRNEAGVTSLLALALALVRRRH